MMYFVLKFRLFWIICCTVCCISTPIYAQEITLETKDGKLEIKGRLLHFDGMDYRVQTEHGALTVRGKNMICTGWDCPKQEQLIEQAAFIGGGDLVMTVMPILIQEFAKSTNHMAMGNPHSKKHLTMHLQHLNLDPIAQIDLAGDPTSVETLDPIYLGDPPKGDLAQYHETIIARGALLPIVHADNPVRELTVQQITDILTKKITNWSALGGSDHPISIYIPRDLVDHPYQLPTALRSQTLTGIIRIANDKQVEEKISQRKGALGLVRYHNRTDSQIVKIATQCNWSFSPSAFNIQSGEYPLSFDYKMYLPRKRLSRNQSAFVNWLKTKTAHDILSNRRYVGLWPDQSSLHQQGHRLTHAIQDLSNDTSTSILQDMIKDLNTAHRLSTTFRYNETGDHLDAASTGYASMLSDAISQGQFYDKTLIFAGFTDNRQGNGAAVAAGLKRAKLVMQEVFNTPYIEDLDQTIATAVSYGRVAPITCNSTPETRAQNWRVEVWIKDR